MSHAHPPGVNLAAAPRDPHPARRSPSRSVAPAYEERPASDPLEHAAGKARSIDGGELPGPRRRHDRALSADAVLGKPSRRRRGASAMLEQLLRTGARGRLGLLPAHARAGRSCAMETTRVVFRALTARDLAWYLASRRVGGTCRRVRDPGTRRCARPAHRGRLPERRRAAGGDARARALRAFRGRVWLRLVWRSFGVWRSLVARSVRVGQVTEFESVAPRLSLSAVLFDVDFTLAQPGPDLGPRGLRARSAAPRPRRSIAARYEEARQRGARRARTPPPARPRRRDLGPRSPRRSSAGWVAASERAEDCAREITRAWEHARATSSSTRTRSRCSPELRAPRPEDRARLQLGPRPARRPPRHHGLEVDAAHQLSHARQDEAARFDLPGGARPARGRRRRRR